MQNWKFALTWPGELGSGAANTAVDLRICCRRFQQDRDLSSSFSGLPEHRLLKMS
jgi:hypothetical protein